MNEHSYMAPGTAGTGITVAGFLAGAVFGAAVALLLAPAAGEETRKKIGETARRLGSAASEAMRHGHDSDSDDDMVRGGGGRSSESSRTAGGRSSREPLAGGRTPQPGGPGTPS